MLKPLNHFSRNRAQRDGRDSYCGPCKADYNAAYYQRTKERHNPSRIARRRATREEHTRFLVAYLREHPCVDCGEDDILVLQFDHQGNKRMNISDMIGKGNPWSTILREINKCEVVCANDHQRRTARQQGWQKVLFDAAGA